MKEGFLYEKLENNKVLCNLCAHRCRIGEGKTGICGVRKNIVETAERYGCGSISYTYTEPTIFFELAYDTAKLARRKGIKNVFVTNGYMTDEALVMISPYLDAANVDLKFFNEKIKERSSRSESDFQACGIGTESTPKLPKQVTTLIIP